MTNILRNRSTMQSVSIQNSTSAPSFSRMQENFFSSPEPEAFRNRTEEFQDVAKLSLSRMPPERMIGIQQIEKSVGFSEFMVTAKRIAEFLGNTRRKLLKLSLLSSRTTLFNDNSSEINHLINIVKQDITNLNIQISHLQKIPTTIARCSQTSRLHSKSIVVSLQAELASLTNQFKQVLEARNVLIKKQNDRRSKFSGADDTPTTFNVVAANSFLLREEERMKRESNGTQELAINMGQLQQSVVREKNQHLNERVDAIQNVEETIVQLGEIFHQLAVMVKEQDEAVKRIDANIEEVHFNMESAQLELKKYFQRISSNRWLMIKVFGILFIFLIIFVIFFV